MRTGEPIAGGRGHGVPVASRKWHCPCWAMMKPTPCVLLSGCPKLGYAMPAVALTSDICSASPAASVFGRAGKTQFPEVTPVVLRLKQIDLCGFKSFCDRERLRFSGTGIAAVVGPNGCGKSNICDAVNWVLGEQSAKSLRGARMHDVIFNGSRNRAPAGLATVTLILHDSGSVSGPAGEDNGMPRPVRLPASRAPGEIAVTRKLFSSGKSRYMLNGKVVRLRDVQDLFLGSGLGPNHYAIIEQGRIGRLLSARALDRRAFVEEAAGVTRFKARKRLAELKLANAELNLERVHDILQEVLRQVNSLKRQAERAERYETYRSDLRDALSVLFASRFRVAESEREQIEAEVGRGQGTSGRRQRGNRTDGVGLFRGARPRADSGRAPRCVAGGAVRTADRRGAHAGASAAAVKGCRRQFHPDSGRPPRHRGQLGPDPRP